MTINLTQNQLHEELMLPVEIANFLERPYSSVCQLIKMREFPEPVFNKKGWRMWRRSDVIAWKKANKSK